MINSRAAILGRVNDAPIGRPSDLPAADSASFGGTLAIHRAVVRGGALYEFTSQMYMHARTHKKTHTHTHSSFTCRLDFYELSAVINEEGR